MHIKLYLQNYQGQNSAVDTFATSNSNGCGDDFPIPWLSKPMLCDYCILCSLGDQKSQNSNFG